MNAMIKTKTKDFLLSRVLENKNHNLSIEEQDSLSNLKKDTVKKLSFYIGAGTCGLGAGAGKTKQAIIEYLNTNNVEADITEVGCIGLCSSEPIIDIQIPGRNRISFEKVTADKVSSLLEAVLCGELPEEGILWQFNQNQDENKPWDHVTYIKEHPFFIKQERLVLKNCGVIDPLSIENYIATGGYASLYKVLDNSTPVEICDEIIASGLRGRGGGGFPTGKKWKFAAQEKAEKKYLICNADEGDPGAFMDRAVIEGDPHRLLEGMAIAAYAIGAEKAYVYIRAEYPLAIERLRKAIAEAYEYGFLGKNICGSTTSLELVIKMGAGAFVCGEETALIHSIEGKRGMPRPRPPFPAVQGLFGYPTIINNVESLSNLSSIIEKGATWFSQLGTPSSNGTKVFALSGKITLTGLIEIPMGTTIREIIFDIAKGIPNGKKFKAVQIGGPSGGCITEKNLDIQIEYESLLEVGAMMGSGGLVVMDEDNCMVDVAKFFLDFVQRESCGKCIPCREGTRRMLEILESITQRPQNGEGNDALTRFKGIMQLENLGKVIKETSLCGLGQSAPNPVLST